MQRSKTSADRKRKQRPADDFLLEISPRFSVINRDLPWKQWIILINFSSNSIEYFIANNRILQFTSRNIVTSLFSLATTDIDLARLRHSTFPSALVSACQMMNWPNKSLIWSSTSTLALSMAHFKGMRHNLLIKPHRW